MRVATIKIKFSDDASLVDTIEAVAEIVSMNGPMESDMEHLDYGGTMGYKIEVDHE